MSGIFANEPALVISGIGAILEACLLAAISFGVPITADQKLALGGLGTCLITVLTGIATRSQVTPVATLGLTPQPPATITTGTPPSVTTP